ncbi:MAG: acetylxylan esterase, partial [Desulfitobacterium hafniense]|nr:acetylxylan esterase [Desulfitobacterium hafniense]
NRPYSKGHFSGWMTLGLDSPENFYYHQVYLDCVRMVEALTRQPEVDSARIGLFGKSQGGGLAIVTSALVNKFTGAVEGLNSSVKAVAAAIPFLCDFPGAYQLHNDGPMQELVNYFRLFDPEHKEEDRIFKVLSYFDALNLAPWVTSNTLVSIGMRDTACPPATIYAMYSQLKGDKELAVYPEYGHETVDQFIDKQIYHLASELLG